MGARVGGSSAVAVAARAKEKAMPKLRWCWEKHHGMCARTGCRKMAGLLTPFSRRGGRVDDQECRHADRALGVSLQRSTGVMA